MKTIPLALCVAAFISPLAAFAQSSSPPTTEAVATTREPKQAAPLASVVRGFYIEAKGTGGYTVADQKIPNTPSLAAAYPQAVGQNEKLGSTAGLQLNVGYDLTNNIALQAVAGQLFAAGRRTDVVRDLAVAYGGLQARVAFNMTDRLNLLASAGVAYSSASNQVEKAQKGAAILGGVGFEYYVHVRHFSVGLELSAIAPTSPSRVFVGLSPQIKYTF